MTKEIQISRVIEKETGIKIRIVTALKKNKHLTRRMSTVFYIHV